MESKRYEVKGENGTYGVFVTNQSEPIEVELWNSIEKIVELKKDIPDLDAGGAIHLIESEILRMRNKQKDMQNEQYNSKITLDAFNRHQDQKHKDPLYKLDNNKRAQGKYNSQYENNPWGIPVNTNVMCEKCKIMSVIGLAVHHDEGTTIVYKVFEHPKGERKQHFIRLVKFDDDLTYKQIIRMVQKEDSTK